MQLRRESWHDWQLLAGAGEVAVAPIIRQRADFVLTPAVAARYSTKPLKFQFLCLEMVKVRTPGG